MSSFSAAIFVSLIIAKTKGAIKPEKNNVWDFV